MKTSKGRARAGFSVIELLVSAAVLGIGIVSLISLHQTALVGVARGEEFATAREVAVQRAELFGTMDPDDVPPCDGAATCLLGGGSAFADPLSEANGFECTRWVDGADVPLANGSEPAQGTRFRIDAVVGPHPDTFRHPTARVLTVSVCWLGRDARVHEVQQQRLLVPGA